MKFCNSILFYYYLFFYTFLSNILNSFNFNFKNLLKKNIRIYFNEIFFTFILLFFFLFYLSYNSYYNKGKKNL